MRDERGRYHVGKPIAESVPEWANGCDKCSGGIVSAPPLTGAAPLYMERIAQRLDGTLTFCDCRAGKAYYASLGNRRQRLIEEARKDQRMAHAAHNNTHPDIEAARRDMHAAYENAPAPTVHGEKVPA